MLYKQYLSCNLPRVAHLEFPVASQLVLIGYCASKCICRSRGVNIRGLNYKQCCSASALLKWPGLCHSLGWNRDSRTRARSNNNFGGFIYTLVRDLIGCRVLINTYEGDSQAQRLSAPCVRHDMSWTPSIEDRRDACHISDISYVIFAVIITPDHLLCLPWHSCDNISRNTYMKPKCKYSVYHTDLYLKLIKFSQLYALALWILSASWNATGDSKETSKLVNYMTSTTYKALKTCSLTTKKRM